MGKRGMGREFDVHDIDVFMMVLPFFELWGCLIHRAGLDDQFSS